MPSVYELLQKYINLQKKKVECKSKPKYEKKKKNQNNAESQNAIGNQTLKILIMLVYYVTYLR